jgi:hypothetical protein
VPDTLQAAPTGRAKCRGCGQPILKAALRFGESGANPYAEGEAYSWFHIECGALMRPEKLLPVLEASSEDIGNRSWLLETARQGVQHPRLARLTRAERASSGRAHCRECRELIAKGDWRLALQAFEEGRPSPMGTLHAVCAEAYFGTSQLMERVRRLSPQLEEPDFAELEQLLVSQQRPGLAKTQASQPEDESRLGDAKG